jgi:iron-sulfur cluster repair protein YtfE (RIC family)
MKTKFQLSIAIIALSVFMPSVSTGSQNEFVKEYKKDFAAGKNTQLEISNKYGNVDIKDWNNESVAIEVKVIVRTDNKEKADRVFDYILIRFEQEGDVIRATTEFKANVLRSIIRFLCQKPCR